MGEERGVIRQPGDPLMAAARNYWTHIELVSEGLEASLLVCSLLFTYWVSRNHAPKYSAKAVVSMSIHHD